MTTTTFILILALVVLLGVWIIFALTRKETPLQREPGKLDLSHEFATEIYPDPERREEIMPERELPWDYGETRIKIMARDPHWLYAYWEISEDKKEEIKRIYGEGIFQHSRPVLRVYDVSDTDFNDLTAHNYFEISINDYSNNWYIKVDRPNATFTVDLGRVTEDGCFILIARSNSVYTPRADLSDQIDPNWMMIKELMGGISFGVSSPELFATNPAHCNQNKDKDTH